MLSKLTIHRFRGVRELSIALDGNNLAIIGPNGTGKSSVADAIDFLLTGQLRRLSGEGAGTLSLSKHGPHIDAETKDAWIEGEFRKSKTDPVVVLRREMGKSSELQITGEVTPDIQRLLSLAEKGSHHLLTRREILRYIFTEPSRRAEQVGTLLQLTRIENIRKAIQGAAKDAGSVLRDKTAVGDGRRQSVLRSVSPTAKDETEALTQVNSHRATLGASAISELSAELVRSGLMEPAQVALHPLQAQRTQELLDQGLTWFQSEASQVAEEIISYLEAIEALRNDEDALKSLRASDLLRNGLSLVSDNECPLCLREWEQQELKAVLQSRLEEASAAAANSAGLRSRQSVVRGRLLAVEAAVRSLADQLRGAEAAAATECARFCSDLRLALDRLLPDPVNGEVPNIEERHLRIDALMSSRTFRCLQELRVRSKKLPSPAGSQQAWDQLTGMTNALREYSASLEERKKAARIAEQLAIADKIFVASRDEVLQSTYDAIADRLRALYALIHDDESKFAASLSPTRAGLNLEVDFYGRGEYPPCALHSEGHQDSMGLCLFLTLTEYLANGRMPLLVLDDVLMSVDRGHRRAVAEMLKREFADCQLIITTHDRVWWRQLRTIGLVSPSGAIEFKDWNLNDGPIVIADAGEMLIEAEKALSEKNVPGAAHALRRAVEAYLPDICDALGARVRFRADGEWGAGDFQNAALSQYGDLLKKARSAAESWGDKSVDWESLENVRKATVTAFSSEAWAVNLNVHHNEWSDFEPSDFAPVLAAYKALFDLFLCPQCGSCLRIVEEGPEATGVRCNCSRTTWNLVRKKKT
jgi:recombinational DNA repair ATPase RecF